MVVFFREGARHELIQNLHYVELDGIGLAGRGSLLNRRRTVTDDKLELFQGEDAHAPLQKGLKLGIPAQQAVRLKLLDELALVVSLHLGFRHQALRQTVSELDAANELEDRLLKVRAVVEDKNRSGELEIKHQFSFPGIVDKRPRAVVELAILKIEFDKGRLAA
eukprot:CAMPEP_0172649418 /NCGR_PEP_ID=MMETSP1068-20121228/241774_1 /TAXON_ID=35684 /ORGANISM="Pseudopedinella elastica, Strain CCMP716" /LENGTH=163 /DNA_ID=CAMNT_0013463769 /DNA_START=492 /DNA_END=983 /DNA_ORIENTATION=+